VAMIKTDKIIIGRVDKIDLPAMNVFNVEAKIDTGAYTSSIHCSEITLLEREGKEVLSFHILDDQIPGLTQREFIAESFLRKKIKNSFGHSEERYVIKTAIRVFGYTFETYFSLSNRDNLKYPILLGRKFLRKRFIVDVSRKNISYTRKLKQKL
jgi:hypothetical protein